MKRIPLPDQEKLKTLFRFEKKTGSLFWREGTVLRPGFIRRSEKLAGSKMYPDENSYVVVRVEGKLYFIHRIIWMLQKGKDPGQLEIDHINGIKDDNRWCNLRLATHDNNNQNRKVQKNNSSGYKGVAWHGQREQWRAYVSVGPRGKSKQISLGLHPTPELAAAAVREYREKLHGEFHNHG